MTDSVVWLVLATAFLIQGTIASSSSQVRNHCPVFDDGFTLDCEPIGENFPDFSPSAPQVSNKANGAVLEDTFEALFVLQEDYYNADYGTWPSAIDWTAAVAQTLVTGSLTTLSKSVGSLDLTGFTEWKAKENLISSFYAQVVGSYFGQDVLSVRGQAYDDILWVVLGWLEAVKFISTHSRLHYPTNVENSMAKGRLREALETLPWHGQSWLSSFSHRARIFWNVASHGWDESLCHGGMIWNPRLSPYKNAITNQLWIAASISMYQHFPGDNFTAPWLASTIFPAKDPAHLAAAIEGHKWLMSVNMTNAKGLFVDGYHVDFRKPGNVECDMRDEMVYTYNQGVILTGLLELWAVSGAPSYLQEGHTLIQAVINATGWSLQDDAPVDSISHHPPGQSAPTWHGIGRGGILEERCDASGTCSQDGQTFKGIFFHHLAAFCDSLDTTAFNPDRSPADLDIFRRVNTSHHKACRSYLGWIRHNADAALQTRDSRGRFGMWWGASLFNNISPDSEDDGIDHSAANTTNYRDHGTPVDDIWGGDSSWLPAHPGGSAMRGKGGSVSSELGIQQVLGPRPDDATHQSRTRVRGGDDESDPNGRGRGRTVETQIGGLALLRAYWEISQLPPS